MLTDLTFLSKGRPWPPKSEQKRIERYMNNKLLFEGEHTLVFKEIWERLFRTELQASVELVLNWPKRLSTLWADLLLGELPAVDDKTGRVPEAEYLNDLAEELDLWGRSYMGALDTSRYGNAVLKVWQDEEDESGNIKLSIISPQYWFPVVSSRDASNFEYHVLAWPSVANDVSDGEFARDAHATLYVEIHSKQQIEYRTYAMPYKGGTLGDLIGEAVVVPNPVKRNCVIPIAGLQTSDNVFGLDDYDDMTSIFQELEVRFAQLARVLDRHADPKMYGPEVAVAIDPETGAAVAQTGDYFPLPEGATIMPTYLVWDAQTESSFNQITRLMEQFYMLSETCPAIFGKMEGGSVDSGSALRRLFVAPLAKVNRIRAHFDRALKEVLLVAALLKDDTKVAPVFIWRDGLPDDTAETVQTNATAVAAKISSKLMAIKRAWGCSDIEARAEIVRIAEDLRAAAEIAEPRESTSDAGSRTTLAATGTQAQKESILNDPVGQNKVTA